MPDLALIRGFGLGEDIERLLVAAVALYKIQRFLREGLRLRTACDLEIDGDNGGVIVKRPTEFELTSIEQLEVALPSLVKASSAGFAKPARTEVKFTA